MTPDISDLVSPDLVAADVPAATKKALFLQLGALAAAGLGLDARVVAEGLTQREKLGATGFGQGVAMPHAREIGRAHV